MRLLNMRFIERVLEIVTKKDIDWMELFAGWLTLGFCVCLIAPGNFFVTTPRLAAMQHAGPVALSESFWIVVLVTLNFAQSVAVAAGDRPLTVLVTRRKTYAVNPYLVRMRVAAISVGVWLSVSVLAWPSALKWYVFGVPVPVSMSEWLYPGLAIFSLCASLKLARQVARSHSKTRHGLTEAEHFLLLSEQGAAIHREDERREDERKEDERKGQRQEMSGHGQDYTDCRFDARVDAAFSGGSAKLHSARQQER